MKVEISLGEYALTHTKSFIAISHSAHLSRQLYSHLSLTVASQHHYLSLQFGQYWGTFVLFVCGTKSLFSCELFVEQFGLLSRGCTVNLFIFARERLTHFNISLRRLLGLPSHKNVSGMFVNFNIPSFREFLRKYVYNFRNRLETSDNVIFRGFIVSFPL